MTRDGGLTGLRKRRRTSFAFGVMALFICGFSVPMLEATEYYVAVDHPNASDSNNGLSLAQPFKTLGQAVKALSPGDTLSIKEGIYREVLGTGKDGTPSSPIVVRAYPGDEGKVVIRGSDVVKGWTNDGGGVWSVSWQPLPLIDYPDGWPDYGEYSRRREMVFVNGNQCVALRVYPEREDSLGVSFRSQGRDAKLTSLDAWQMDNIYTAD